MSTRFDICAYKRISLTFNPLDAGPFHLQVNSAFATLVGEGFFHPGDQVMAISSNGYEVFYVYRPSDSRDFHPLSFLSPSPS